MYLFHFGTSMQNTKSSSWEKKDTNSFYLDRYQETGVNISLSFNFDPKNFADSLGMPRSLTKSISSDCEKGMLSVVPGS